MSRLEYRSTVAHFTHVVVPGKILRRASGIGFPQTQQSLAPFPCFFVDLALAVFILAVCIGVSFFFAVLTPEDFARADIFFVVLVFTGIVLTDFVFVDFAFADFAFVIFTAMPASPPL